VAINKLNRPSAERKALLRGLVTSLIWNGKVETTLARAKQARPIAEKIITRAIREYENTITVTKEAGEDKDKTEFTNDAPGRLAARRLIMEYLYDFPETKKDKESKYEYRERTGDNKHPVIEKLFREIAPKYDKRAKELGQGGGYTRILKKGPRRGDAAEIVILELV
jgi:large subunit ribosomal protein L17